MNSTIVVETATVSGTNIILTPEVAFPSTNLANRGNYYLYIPTSVPKVASDYQIYIQTSDSKDIPVFDKYGNPVMASMIYKGYRYGIGFGNANTEYTDGQFVIQNKLCRRYYQNAMADGRSV